MLKKLFALASLTALTGLLASIAASGCSSETTVTTLDGSTDASRDRSTQPIDSGPVTCPTEEPIDTSAYKWRSPTLSPGACTEANLQALITYTENNEDATFKQLRDHLATISTTCASCAFGTDGTTWPPMVLTSTGNLSVLNVGGCIAIASGSDGCGKAYQAWFECRFEACADCPDGDTTGFRSCLTAASQGACSAAIDKVLDACGEQIEEYETTCDNDQFVFEAPIRAQCIGPSDGGDAGGDADADAS